MEAHGPSAQCGGLFIPLVIKQAEGLCLHYAPKRLGPVLALWAWTREQEPLLSCLPGTPCQWQESGRTTFVFCSAWEENGISGGSLPCSFHLSFTSDQGKTHVKRQDRGPGWGVQLCSSTAIVHSSITPDQGFQSSIPGCWKAGRMK